MGCKMKVKAIEPIVTFVIIAAVSILIYFATVPIFNSFWVLVISFYALLCFYYQAKSLVDMDSPTWRVIKFCSYWYIKHIGDTIGYLVIFFVHVTYIAATCFIISFVVTLIISPFSFLVYENRK